MVAPRSPISMASSRGAWLQLLPPFLRPSVLELPSPSTWLLHTALAPALLSLVVFAPVVLALQSPPGFPSTWANMYWFSRYNSRRRSAESNASSPPPPWSTLLSPAPSSPPSPRSAVYVSMSASAKVSVLSRTSVHRGAARKHKGHPGR